MGGMQEGGGVERRGRREGSTCRVISRDRGGGASGAGQGALSTLHCVGVSTPVQENGLS